MKLVTYIANIINIRIFLNLIKFLTILIHPFTKIILGRKVSKDYLKYNVLLSLRNLHYGVPFKIPKKYKIKTAETESSSGKMTIAYKIIVSKNKKSIFSLS